MRADHLIITAGALTLVSNFKDSGGFPPNGIQTVAATSVLAFLAALTKDSAIAPAVSAFAALVLLVTVFRFVPGLTKKGK